MLLNEHWDPSFLIPNLSSYNINNQLLKFEKKSQRRYYFSGMTLRNRSKLLPFAHWTCVIFTQVVRSNLKKECKCHGVTGSCNLKTCWKELAPFNVIGSELKQKYRAAVRVSFLNNKLHNNNRDRLMTTKHKKLVYLDSSPDYCVRNVTAGSPGMLGRSCRSDAVSSKECRSLCNSCQLRHQTKELYKQVKCRCNFVWCCTVKCQLCNAKYSLTTCTK